MNALSYIDRDSLIHRLSAGWKLSLLILISTGIFFIQDWRLICAVCVIVCACYSIAQFSVAILWRQIKTGLWFCAFLFIIQCIFNNWQLGILISVRLLSLLLLAALLTLTTPLSQLLDTLNRALQWLTYLHINPKKVSLAISLTLRFIPVIQQITEEVREAQKVRGLERSVIAIVIPVIIRTLKSADDIADAITCRGFE